MLRVLIVLPLYGGSLPVGRYCAQALKELGHMVEVFEAPEFFGAYKAMETLKVTPERLEYLQNSYLQVVGQAVGAKVETFEPDLVLAMAQAPMSRQLLKRLKRDKVATAMWFVEDFRLFTYWQAYAPYYDLFCVIQKEPFFSQLEAIGQNNYLYLPLAAEPDTHKPLDLAPADKKTYGSKISFMGAGYPNRRLAFRKLIQPGFKIWGTEWEGDPVLAPYVQMDGKRVTPEECAKIFNATDININLHSSVRADKLVSFGDFVNPRTFELAGCGAFQLVDEREYLPELFAPDEMATFTSIEDLKEKIEHFRAHPDQVAEFAQKARARVLKEHTYAIRMQALIEFATDRLEDWPKRNSLNSFEQFDLPEEVKAELEELRVSLELPAGVGFEDMVWALRQKNTPLTGIETSVFFLDEWRKQYC